MVRKSPVVRLLETRRASSIADVLKLFNDGWRIIPGPLTYASGCRWWKLANYRERTPKYIPIPEGWR
jgi:hypothetical protein